MHSVEGALFVEETGGVVTKGLVESAKMLIFACLFFAGKSDDSKINFTIENLLLY
jgi:hypothetical protein